MTAKEKAYELILKIETELIDNRVYRGTIKKLALIAVDEIINCDYFFKTLEDTKSFTDYWYKVQQEIEKI